MPLSPLDLAGAKDAIESLPAPAEAALRDRLLTLLREKLCDCKPSA